MGFAARGRLYNSGNNHHLLKSILDAGWNYLAQRLTSKAEEAGRVVIQVDPAYTSKACSACGYIFNGLKLSHRWVICPSCGLSMDRDHNTAINILNRGLLSLGKTSRDGQSLWVLSALKSEALVQEAAGF